jgi:hypothetical protein
MWSGKFLTVLEWENKSGEEVLGSPHNTGTSEIATSDKPAALDYCA